jgi:uncharacterized membrane protein YphA (DoxX/SURF4 family)
MMGNADSPTPATATAEAGLRTRRRALNIGLWILQALLAFLFLASGIQKLAGTQDMVDLFSAIGVGQWLRYAIGILEIAGAVGLLVSRLCGLAALGLVALMVGATIVNAIIGYNVLYPIGYLVVAAVIVLGRRSRIRLRPWEPLGRKLGT